MLYGRYVVAGRYAMDLGIGKRRKSRIDAAIESSVRGGASSRPMAERKPKPKQRKK